MKMKKLIFILLIIPFLSICQNKKVLKEQIIQKNDFFNLFLNYTLSQKHIPQ